MTHDVAVIGAGIAGAAAACEIAAARRTLLLEREDQPGYHTTGRSAALYTENYGNAVVRAITLASRSFFERPPEGFAPGPVLSPRGALMIASPEQGREAAEALAAARDDGSFVEIAPEDALRRVPVLSRARLARAFLEPDAMDMDVHAIHQAFLRGFRARGGRLVTGAGVQAIERRDGAWRLRTPAGAYTAAVIVDAAGAWVDEVAGLAGIAPLGLVPKRRTAFTFDPPEGIDAAGWPMVMDVGETFYFKPESGRLLGSPADETPSPPCDAQPEELDLAIAVDRIEQATTMRISRIARKWAGLRSFVADKSLVAGWAAAAPGFLFLAGQGGYGIMTAPAMGRIAAALVEGRDLPADCRALGLSLADLSPARLAG